MLRHQPILAAEIYADLPSHLTTYFDGTFGHGGHVTYLLSHLVDPETGRWKTLSPTFRVIACDIDPAMLQKGLTFTQQREKHIIPVLDTYAHIDQI
jgi:16S rRNA C1402 N4-methylase RsmH